MRNAFCLVVIIIGFSWLSFGQIEAAPLSKFALKVDGVVLVSDADIEHYNWNTHTISVYPTAADRIEKTWPWPPKVGSLPKVFVVEINGTEVYSGHIYVGFQSYLPSGPLIEWPLRDPRSIEIIVRVPVARDLRGDKRVLAALESLGVLAK